MVKVNPNDHMYHYRAVHQQMITDKMKQGENHNKYHLPTLGLKKKNIINKDILKHHKNYKSCSTQVTWKKIQISGVSVLSVLSVLSMMTILII